MNGQVVYEDIQKLVGNERKCDLLVIGLQEVPRTNVLELLENALFQSHVFLGKAVMQSLQLYMFCMKNSEMHIKELRIDKQGVGGCGGLIRRKKGGVAIRITYKGIHMVFISCHLSAHAHNVEERNSECRHISHSLFSKSLNPYAQPAQVTVWLGDLNYRLQGINTIPVRNLIHKNLHGLLTTKDQLLQEAERGQVFNGYCEGTLAFKPTYKYNIGTSDYDTSYKVRVPAWTDRILYKIDDKEIDATLHLYDSIEGIFSSDHKPVKAHLCLKVNNL
ncbi:type i inositol 1 4 5-trisphosphate 5-phosphatase 11 [Phtheirospermum japonicum]|uniref:Type i inositol 1 4 5-trisphosphate 5-phosphatase 11 n=1 Tax=Phtheirospermum japonicum TaxID=374723 RepID=A0A830CY96_9LAMI|nr:type i inositol 1 4 5-trisphosphate 5-phosphatase 11 [Phtheirospermum japonicum]